MDSADEKYGGWLLWVITTLVVVFAVLAVMMWRADASLGLIHRSELIPIVLGFGAAAVFVGLSSYDWRQTSAIGQLWTVLHELKHAIAVVLCGHRLKRARVAADKVGDGEQLGYVDFEINERFEQTVPFVYLAPYSLPLFSLPVFAWLCVSPPPTLAMVGNGFSFDGSTAYLLYGLCLGLDVSLAVLDFHGKQFDFSQIPGGMLIGYLFTVGWNMSWAVFTVLHFVEL